MSGRTMGCCLAALFLYALPVAAQAPTAAQQVAAAVTAAPEHLQAEAAVLGYDASGALVTLREGQNEMICLADTPGDDRFSVACYHQSLEPFMALGRSLRAAGMEREEVDQKRQAAVEAGTISMPEVPAALYIRYGDAGSYDYANADVGTTKLRYVIYTPFATPESTGLTPTPAPGVPWLMSPGKPWAHIMIIPQGP